MPEATIDENGWFVCGECTWTPNVDMLIIDSPHNDISFVGNTLLDDLYAVLHARHMAQAYDKTYLSKVEKAAQSLKDDDLYKSDGAY